MSFLSQLRVAKTFAARDTLLVNKAREIGAVLEIVESIPGTNEPWYLELRSALGELDEC